MTIRAAQRPKAEAPVSPFAHTKCGKCIALCCRYFAIQVDKPTRPADFEDLRWYLLHERTSLFVSGSKWYVQVFNRCTNLGDDNQCKDYEHRPKICRDYTDKGCDFDGGSFDLMIPTVEALETYRKSWMRKRATRLRRRKAEKR